LNTNILASLCWRGKAAISFIQHKAARTFGCLFAVIAIPLPLPQITTKINFTFSYICCNCVQSDNLRYQQLFHNLLLHTLCFKHIHNCFFIFGTGMVISNCYFHFIYIKLCAANLPKQFCIIKVWNSFICLK
jgi:hypothetical protein